MPTPILIIDDDQKLCRLLREYLKPHGFEVDLAHTGSEGLQQARKGSYAAIILDVMLPGMSGHEVLRELRKELSTPVLMFTGLGSEQDRIDGLDVGADDYLPKTFSSPELLARLRALVRRSLLNSEELRNRDENRRELEQARGRIESAEEQGASLLDVRCAPQARGGELTGLFPFAGAVERHHAVRHRPGLRDDRARRRNEEERGFR